LNSMIYRFELSHSTSMKNEIENVYKIRLIFGQEIVLKGLGLIDFDKRELKEFCAVSNLFRFVF